MNDGLVLTSLDRGFWDLIEKGLARRLRDPCIFIPSCDSRKGSGGGGGGDVKGGGKCLPPPMKACFSFQVRATLPGRNLHPLTALPVLPVSFQFRDRSQL